MTSIKWFVKQLRNGKELNDNLIQQAKEMESIEKHAEYMRGWKDGYSKNEPKPE